ncbi:hypothetical protein [Opitutus sp. ER46]|uniref:hypothetical protein n=1 Tax=Opitutus sp. ER46 TaxID=2161864 RepID=UPI001304F1D3|nr:hypothetical protein [Opitutus sp. ER46]
MPQADLTECLLPSLMREVRELRQELRGTAAVKRIEPNAVYSIDEAAALIPGLSAKTICKRLRCRSIIGQKGGLRSPWMIRGSELLKLGGKVVG